MFLGSLFADSLYHFNALENEIDSTLKQLSQKGYPFALVKISDTALEGYRVDSGSYIDSIEYVVNTDSLKPWLVTNLLGGKNVKYRDINRNYIENVLKIAPYINNAKILPPLLKGSDDTTSVLLPIEVTPIKSLLFDAALTYQSESDNNVVGYGKLHFTNLFKYGESFGVDYYGDKVTQRLQFVLTIPMIFKSRFSFKLNGFNEVKKNEWGKFFISFDVLYHLWDIWVVSGGASYSETTIDVDNYNKNIGFLASLKRSNFNQNYKTLNWGLFLSLSSVIIIDKKGKLPSGRVSLAPNIELPLWKKFTYYDKLSVEGIAITDYSRILDADKIRVGGVNSFRGYNEDSFFFDATLINQSELRYYLNKSSSLFILGDIGGGVEMENSQDRKFLFGYGGGIRTLTKNIKFTLIWARHYREPLGLGRIHFSIGN